MKYYNLTSKECLEKLKSNKNGLSEVEAEKRLKENGHNKLKEAKKESNLAKFLSQFKNLMIIVLLLASIVSFISCFARLMFISLFLLRPFPPAPHAAKSI